MAGRSPGIASHALSGAASQNIRIQAYLTASAINLKRLPAAFSALFVPIFRTSWPEKLPVALDYADAVFNLALLLQQKINIRRPQIAGAATSQRWSNGMGHASAPIVEIL
jgi:hypothetical protein